MRDNVYFYLIQTYYFQDSPMPEFLDKYKKRTRKSNDKTACKNFKNKLLIITLGIEMDKKVLAIPVSIVVG